MSDKKKTFQPTKLTYAILCHTLCHYAILVLGQLTQGWYDYALQIIELCLKFICHDPNYNYGDDNDENMETDQDEEDEE